MSAFWSQVVKAGTDECWPWTGPRNGDGYGRFQRQAVHRIAYEALVGPIPTGLVIDHLCRTRACCNPRHMEPVTNAENIRRGISPAGLRAQATACPKGHEYTPENTRIRPDNGCRQCRQCHRDRLHIDNRRKRLAQREARNLAAIEEEPA